MKVEKTYKEIFLFDTVSSNYIKNFKDKSEEEDSTTLIKSIESVHKQIRKIIPEYHEKIDLIRMANCLKDDKTRKLVMENKDYTFTEPGLKTVKEKLKELELETVTIHQRILPENNNFDLNGMEKEAFAGFVIDEFEDEFEKQFKDEEEA